MGELLFCDNRGLLFPGKGKKMRMVVIHCKGAEQAQALGYFQRSGP